MDFPDYSHLSHAERSIRVQIWNWPGLYGAGGTRLRLDSDLSYDEYFRHYDQVMSRRQVIEGMFLGGRGYEWVNGNLERMQTVQVGPGPKNSAQLAEVVETFVTRDHDAMIDQEWYEWAETHFQREDRNFDAGARRDDRIRWWPDPTDAHEQLQAKNMEIVKKLCSELRSGQMALELDPYDYAAKSRDEHIEGIIYTHTHLETLATTHMLSPNATIFTERSTLANLPDDTADCYLDLAEEACGMILFSTGFRTSQGGDDPSKWVAKNHDLARDVQGRICELRNR